MNRRRFLQKSLILPGLGLSGLWAPGKLLAENTARASLSLSVVSDHPQEAIAMIQALLGRSHNTQRNIQYTEYILSGRHMADIVYTQSGQLIDFYKQKDPFSVDLQRISKHLDLPHSCENPVLSHFSIGSGLQKPAGFRVFKDNTLIMEKTFNDKTESIVLDGAKGRIVLESGADHSVCFTEAACNHKTCISMGKIKQAGQNLVCVPNQITVSIAGRPVSGVDSITF
jgi:hypothetical protein